MPFLMEMLRGVPLIVLFAAYRRTRNGTYILAGFLVILLSTIVLSLIALVPTGSKHRGRLERIARKI